ncbi:MAG: hypothetical protein ACM3X9_14805, partial [Bacillota bacterium]
DGQPGRYAAQFDVLVSLAGAPRGPIRRPWARYFGCNLYLADGRRQKDRLPVSPVCVILGQPAKASCRAGVKG